MARAARLILFDAVGTLLHPDPPVAEAYQAVGARFGSAHELAVIRARFRDALARYAGRALLPAVGMQPGHGTPQQRSTTDEARERARWLRIVAHVFDDVPQSSHAIFAALWNHFAAAGHWRLDSELAQVWSELDARGYQLGIASNFDARLIGVCRAHPPLDGSRHIYHSSQLGFVKPDPRFYRAIEQRTGWRGGQIVLIGDDPLHDFEAPRAVGWQSILLDPSAPHGPAAVARVRGLSDLLSLL